MFVKADMSPCVCVCQILRGHMTSVRAVAFSSDGCHIASASLDGDVKVWSATKGVQVMECLHAYKCMFLCLVYGSADS